MMMEDYVKVPVEPDSEMMNRGADELREALRMLNSGRSYQYVATRTYKAMLAAAPAQGNPADPQLWCNGDTVPAAVELPEMPTRYNVYETYNGPQMDIEIDGPWVVWSDYDALRTAAEALRARLAEVECGVCPACKNEFKQRFLCITCGAQRLYDVTLKTAQQRAETAERQLSEEVKRREALTNLLGECRCYIDSSRFDEEGEVIARVDEALKGTP